jgi:hypothetical protein
LGKISIIIAMYNTTTIIPRLIREILIDFFMNHSIL